MANIKLFQIDNWHTLRYDGRKSIFRDITRQQYRDMCNKHYFRMNNKSCQHLYEPIMEIKRDIAFYRQAGRYAKRLIIGHTHIYWASPVYEHQDYNKSIFADNTPKNRRKAELINKLLDK